MGLEQRIHLGLQLRIVAAKVRGLFILPIGGLFADSEKNLLDALVLFGGHCLTAEFPHQPGAGHGPIALDGPLGDAEDFGNFLDAHAGEESHLHDLRLPGIELSELGEGFIESEDFLGPFGREGD